MMPESQWLPAPERRACKASTMRGIEFALNDICLAAFTTVAPGAALAYVALACTLLFGHADERTRAHMESWLIVPLAVATVGLVASASHLGTPSNALYVLRGVGSSPLATEVLCAVVFLGTACSYWFACIYVRGMRALRAAWLAVSVVTAVAFVWGTDMAYAMPTVITWDTSLAQALLPITGLASATPLTLLVYACSGYAGRRLAPRLLAGAGFVATLAACALMAAQWGALQQARNAFGTAASLVPLYPTAIAAYGACLSAANLAAPRVLRVAAAGGAGEGAGGKSAEGFSRAERRSILGLAGLCALAFAGTFAVRFCFYCFHMTSGVV